ncbi:hypothetical protein C2S53_020646 [Perilla frutescens var. hirtella]|uniref:Uncharacterized protein n=1 Tax=Perilla frutescens var. hirtella TaxID=608512 RepID=A0AAD4IL13_PERFH|nr:hypothetical protein C2S53_020646 [Perilla frutescens var. hirtella]
MSSSKYFFFLAIYIAVVVASLISLGASKCSKAPVLFNFGDSNSDTGGVGALMVENVLMYPNGRIFFQYPTGRLCDAEDLKIGYVTPYLESLNPNFKNGANFALAGSSAMPGEICPYSLKTQVFEFVRFYNRSLQLRLEGHENLLEEDNFRNGLYMIDIGQNDLKNAFDTIPAYDQIIQQRIPKFISKIGEAMQAIYANGGRKFWIHNTGPLGCLPGTLSIKKPNASEVDDYGCVASINRAAQEFNSKLNALCEGLRFELQNSTIVYVDVYAIKYKIIASASSYGFEQPLMACCGYGGPPYNIDPKIGCGKAGHNLCAASSPHISWDGFHYSEAANSIVASMILSGNYSSPPLPFDFFC